MLNHIIREEGKRGEHACCDVELKCVADFLLKEMRKIVENWRFGSQGDKHWACKLNNNKYNNIEYTTLAIDTCDGF